MNLDEKLEFYYKKLSKYPLSCEHKTTRVYYVELAINWSRLLNDDVRRHEYLSGIVESIENYARNKSKFKRLNEVYQFIGDLHSELNNEENSIEAYLKAIELKLDGYNGFFDYHFMKIINLNNMNAINKAIDVFKNNIYYKSNVELHVVFRILCELYLKLNNLNESKKNCIKAITLQPDGAIYSDSFCNQNYHIDRLLHIIDEIILFDEKHNYYKNIENIECFYDEVFDTLINFDNDWLLRKICDYLTDKKQYKQAQLILIKSIELNPNGFIGLYDYHVHKLIKLLQLTNHYCITYIDRCLSKLDEKRNGYNANNAVYHKFDEIYALKGDLLYELDRKYEAFNSYIQAYTLKPNGYLKFNELYVDKLAKFINFSHYNNSSISIIDKLIELNNSKLNILIAKKYFNEKDYCNAYKLYWKTFQTEPCGRIYIKSKTNPVNYCFVYYLEYILKFKRQNINIFIDFNDILNIFDKFKSDDESLAHLCNRMKGIVYEELNDDINTFKCYIEAVKYNSKGYIGRCTNPNYHIDQVLKILDKKFSRPVQNIDLFLNYVQIVADCKLNNNKKIFNFLTDIVFQAKSRVGIARFDNKDDNYALKIYFKLIEIFKLNYDDIVLSETVQTLHPLVREVIDYVEQVFSPQDEERFINCARLLIENNLAFSTHILNLAISIFSHGYDHSPFNYELNFKLLKIILKKFEKVNYRDHKLNIIAIFDKKFTKKFSNYNDEHDACTLNRNTIYFLILMFRHLVSTNLSEEKINLELILKTLDLLFGMNDDSDENEYELKEFIEKFIVELINIDLSSEKFIELCKILEDVYSNKKTPGDYNEYLFNDLPNVE